MRSDQCQDCLWATIQTLPKSCNFNYANSDLHKFKKFNEWKKKERKKERKEKKRKKQLKRKEGGNKETEKKRSNYTLDMCVK